MPTELFPLWRVTVSFPDKTPVVQEIRARISDCAAYDVCTGRRDLNFWTPEQIVAKGGRVIVTEVTEAELAARRNSRGQMAFDFPEELPLAQAS